MNKKLETIIKGIYSLQSLEMDSVVDAIKLMIERYKSIQPWVGGLKWVQKGRENKNYE